MEKEKGISKLVLVVIIALIIVAAIYWAGISPNRWPQL